MRVVVAISAAAAASFASRFCVSSLVSSPECCSSSETRSAFQPAYACSSEPDMASSFASACVRSSFSRSRARDSSSAVVTASSSRCSTPVIRDWNAVSSSTLI